jgi:4-amino-4-deoxy-L-arabinose transferase-like glycosyltransferase/membrane-associated phospholipid phosphatase
MHWLQSLDTHLFLFVNRSLVNPVFDWLMPVLSGGGDVMHWFVLTVAAGAIAALCLGTARLRLCALLMVLAVVLGDPLIVNTIKHAVARPRPFVTLPDARQFGVVGQGYLPPEKMAADTPGLNSFPSAHAANWFAATMVAFLFYRKSWRFMLPLAAAVAFSRVYNGVHYPSDVLAGAILGAGYAAAGVFGPQFLWNWIGKKWFPLWHEKMPSFVSPISSPQPTVHGQQRNAESKSPIVSRQSEIEWLRLGQLLILLMLIGRWLYLASGAIELSQDEAYQWVWSKHPALSYYSKPPAIAFIQLASTSIFGDTEFGVRFFSPLFAAITSLLLLRFLAREAGARVSFWLLLAATATPLLGIGSILMTIDPPLVLCWTWAIVAGWRAVAATPRRRRVGGGTLAAGSFHGEATGASQLLDGNTRDWLIVGLAMGLGFLCKYTAVLQIPCWAILFALAPATRIHLRKPGPWLALLVFSICTLPVVIWNSQRGWPTLNDVGGDAGLHGQWHPTLRYVWDFLGSESALLNPVFFIGALWAMIGFWKIRRERPLWLYLFCMGAPVFLGYGLWSFHSRILPNWIAVAILPMFCLMAVYWTEKFRAGSQFGAPSTASAQKNDSQLAGAAPGVPTSCRWVKPFFVAGVALGIFAIAVMYQSNLIGKLTGAVLPGEKDPSRRVRGWKAEAALVETEREKLAANGRPAFIIAGHYGITGLYSFYIPQARAALKSEPLVYSLDSDEPRNQFYFWQEYNYLETRKGQNAIFVSEAGLYKLEDGWIWKWLAHEPINRAAPPPVTLPSRIAQEFESVTDLGEHDVKIGDRVFHRVHLWACDNLK